MDTTENDWVDFTDDETYETFDNYLNKGQQLAMRVEEGLQNVRELTIQVRDGEMTMEEYDEHEEVEEVEKAIRAFEYWATEPPR